MHAKQRALLDTGLYSPEFERDNCGFGMIAHIEDKPSHGLLRTAIVALERMTHRGGISADGKSGDGCGLLIKKPDGFFRVIAEKDGFTLADVYAVGLIFLHTDEAIAQTSREALNKALTDAGLEVAGWRVVPTDKSVLGRQALDDLPQIEHVFVNAPEGMDSKEFEAKLYVARRRADKVIRAADKDEAYYVASLSSQTLSYKGLVMPEDLERFYLDLSDETLETSQCVFHQRFSTNTFPQWKLAQPFRYLAHNGEINTIRGNRNWAVARGSKFETPAIPDLNDALPLVNMTGSDSSSMDNMLEALIVGGMETFRALRTIVPPAWQNDSDMDEDLKAFYEYNSMHMEPWDGPAGIVLTDGRYATCALDRNGLRPSRWVRTNDGHIMVASEIGVYDYKPENVVAKGRLKPGEIMAIDTLEGKILRPHHVNEMLKNRKPYKAWLDEQTIHLNHDHDTLGGVHVTNGELASYEKMFQLTFEERDQVLRVLAENGQEATGAMGDDTPMAVLSQRARPLYDYFRQQFAQVTNPPIDPIREKVVMSLETCLGEEHNIFYETPELAHRVVMDTPILSPVRFREVQEIENGDLFGHAMIGMDFDSTGETLYGHETIDLNYDSTTPLEAAVKAVTDQAVAAVRAGTTLIILSDRHIGKGKQPMHALLATGAVHHRLIEEGLRCDANIIVETATARDAHHMCVLIGYGASAVYPYLAFDAIADMQAQGLIQETDSARLAKNYVAGLGKGMLKILSKMGISTIASYRGAQLFEIVGLGENVVNLCFKGTTSRIQGADFDDLHIDQHDLARDAWDESVSPSQGGKLKYIDGGEYHAYNPDVVRTLQDAVNSGEYSDWEKFSAAVNDRPVTTLRDMFAVRDDLTAIDLDEVEPIADIVRRFDSAAISLGALSPEAHETLAEAMNRLGARSNSGEGGEDPVRYGTEKRSKIKQVASGRFGVTPHYLVNAEVLQIKVAQGAKPGEGGQLPGKKVNELIARLRYSVPGVTLISPPPHHDIYSIEDLAQLIFDLKQVNPEAKVSVKLVSEPGVGTVAAGVAKAYADLITISGYDGGTGASPITSVHYAGSPFELGLAETHQTLRANELRDKVTVQADGGLKTGLDVFKAAILGAESFGFGTAPMIAMGCKYLRICHLNNCAVGVATQHEVLRLKHFKGDVEKVMNYFTGVAQEIRHLMASVGVHTMDELIGRYDLLEQIEPQSAKQAKLDLTPLLSEATLLDAPNICAIPSNIPHDKGELAEEMVKQAISAIEGKTGGAFAFEVKNTDRSIGARLSGEIAKRHGNLGMENTPIQVNLTGRVGQSWGVWNAGGLHMHLEGDANDYVGKGMTAGKLAVRPPKESNFNSWETPIIGNTCLYGATGGYLFAAGRAGERFGVRNSGALAVVEGTGDHCCEYMTGGMVCALGRTGSNFGAGMTGGLAFVYDEDGGFAGRHNPETTELVSLKDAPVEVSAFLKQHIQMFVNETDSKRGRMILDDFKATLERFVLVKPTEAELSDLLAPRQRVA